MILVISIISYLSCVWVPLEEVIIKIMQKLQDRIPRKNYYTVEEIHNASKETSELSKEIIYGI